MTELRQLAQFAVEFRLDQAPEQVIQAAKFCVLDSVGAAVGAAKEPETLAVCREICRWTKSDSMYQASVWGQNICLDVFQALLLNGMMGHALELDDVHTASKSHIGAVAAVTAWTVAEAMKESGRAFLEAVIVGYEVMARIGMAMDVVSNRKRGWHSTGVIGTFGAAAAAGHLLRLKEDQMVSALGMAGTQSSGLWAFLEEGATCKKLHPARAAVNGLTAAVLAGAGMTGPEHILDARDGGLYPAVTDSWDLSRLTENLGDNYEILHMDKKPYPCCRTTHPAIDAALKLRAGLDLDQIERIVVKTYEVGVLQCGMKGCPKTAVEAKFSIPFTAAAALVRGKVTQEEFTDRTLADPGIRHLTEKVTVVSDVLFSERYPGRWGCRMEIVMKSGEEKTMQIDDMSGSAACPLTAEQELGKFKGLAEPVLGARASRELLSHILKMETEKLVKQVNTDEV